MSCIGRTGKSTSVWVAVLGAFLVVTALSSVALARTGSRSGPYSVSVRSAHGGNLPTFQHHGGTYVLGHLGRRYEIIVRNHSNRRVEAVVSVDGLDAIDGKRAGYGKRGYIVDAHGTLKIDGFRVSMRNVAAFRFSSVRSSYAGRKGQTRNVGVIGVAIFPEKRRRRPDYRPWDPYWRPQPNWRRERHDRGKVHPRAGRGAPTDADASGKSDGYYGEGSARGRGASELEAGQDAPSLSRPRSSAGGGRHSFEAKKRRQRKGLGTQFGERRYSPVSETRFERQSRHYPVVALTVRYNDRDGLRKLGIRCDPWRPDWRREVQKRETARPFRQSPRDFAEPPRGW